MTDTATIDARARTDAVWLRVIQFSLAIAMVGLIIEAIVGTWFTTVSDGGPFVSAADYWYTASGLPIGIGGIGHAIGVHRLQHGADGRLGAIGVWLYVAALSVLTVQLAASVALGVELQLGPTYLVGTALTFIGLALLAAGSWRVGLVPAWLLGVWPVVWVLGSFLAMGPTPLLLIAIYVVFWVVLTRRVAHGAPTR